MIGYLFHTDPLKSGHMTQMLNNYIVAGHKWGLNSQKMANVLNVGLGLHCSSRIWVSRRGSCGDGATGVVKRVPWSLCTW